MVMGSLFLEQPTFGSTIFPCTDVPTDSLTLFRLPLPLPFPTAISPTTTMLLLFGASDSYGEDEKMQITVALNHFGKGLVERMPRCRFGFIHVVNNDYTHWVMYAI
ncbi:hypothetical protein V6N12_056631 [Hibiscus sabdariffa]|uniref:Pectate lyase n=1 Tax=Hibiscus sabdariffa TaxID=183260 RepID=A0ABR2CT22_9ROSI